MSVGFQLNSVIATFPPASKIVAFSIPSGMAGVDRRREEEEEEEREKCMLSHSL